MFLILDVGHPPMMTNDGPLEMWRELALSLLAPANPACPRLGKLGKQRR